MGDSSEIQTRIPSTWLLTYWTLSRAAAVIYAAGLLFAGVADSWRGRIPILIIMSVVVVVLLVLSRTPLRRATWEVPNGMTWLSGSARVQVVSALIESAFVVALVIMIRSGPHLKLWPYVDVYPGTSVILAVGMGLIALAIWRLNLGRHAELPRTTQVLAGTLYLGVTLYALTEAARLSPLSWLPGQIGGALLVLAGLYALHWLAVRLDQRRTQTAG